MIFKKLKFKGFSLLEILVSIGVFSILITSVGVFTLDTFKSISNADKKVKATLILEELSKGLSITKNDFWNTVVQKTGTGPKHLEFANNTYSLVDGSITKDGFTQSITIENALRDSNGTLVESGGNNDVKSRSVLLSITWKDIYGGTNSTSSRIYINDWNNLLWKETTQANFNAGSRLNTVVGTYGDGDVRLDTVIYADWCNPSITLTSANLSGQGIAKTITAIPGKAFVGTGNNASGLSYASINISNTDPPVATESGTFNGYKTNAVFGETNYAYLGTDNNSKEIVILSISGTPTEIGSFNSPGSGQGTSVVVNNNIGYMTDGDKLYVFDLSSRTGVRSQIGNALTLAGTGNKIIINGNYAYIATTSTASQLQIVDITNPASLQIVGSATVAGQGGVDLYVSSSTDRVYLATAVSATQKELFIINTTTKTGSRPTIGSYETNGMDPKGVTIASTDRAIIVGSGGEEYQVLNITSETAPVRCGGMEINTNVNGLASVVESDGDAYSYIVTGDSSNELKLIKGGPGGGNGLGQGHPPTGTFTSQVFDTQSTTTVLNSIEWVSQMPANTTLQLQLRSGDSISEINANSWYGSDGTSSTYFTSSTGNAIPTTSQGKRYIQYKAFYTSDKLSTAILESVNIYYQK